jgi:hypothetical protein
MLRKLTRIALLCLIVAVLPLMAATNVSWGTATMNLLSGSASVSTITNGLNITVSSGGTSFSITQPFTITADTYTDNNSKMRSDTAA